MSGAACKTIICADPSFVNPDGMRSREKGLRRLISNPIIATNISKLPDIKTIWLVLEKPKMSCEDMDFLEDRIKSLIA